MTTRNWIAVGLTIVSLFLIVPGLRSDALTITASIPIFNKPTEIYKETQSILRAIRRLYDSQNYFVAGLILLFSVIVPFIKMALLGVILRARNPITKYRLYLLTRSMSKWAMADVFAVGQKVDVQGTTIGKGFAGTIKRHHMKSQRATHGNSRSHNVPGSIGMAQDPGRVFPGKRMTGHLGDDTVTTQNLDVFRIDEARQLLLIRGAVPGHKGGFVTVRPAVKVRPVRATKPAKAEAPAKGAK